MFLKILIFINFIACCTIEGKFKLQNCYVDFKISEARFIDKDWKNWLNVSEQRGFLFNFNGFVVICRKWMQRFKHTLPDF